MLLPAAHSRLLARVASRLHARRLAVRVRSTTTTSNAALREVCSAYGIPMHSSVHLQTSQWGQGLACSRSSTPTHKPLVAVPLDLVLSVSIPGCSPSPDQITPELQQLVHSSGVSQSWEMQVAALLLWALRQPPQSRIGGFWQQYRQHLPGGVQDCSSLLVWSRAELRELQDPSLETAAQQWQQTVHAAYDSGVQPFFSRTSQPCSLEEWVWSVATVESRAFGAARADVSAAAAAAASHASAGRRPASGEGELIGLVPVLDLANHSPRPRCHHRLDPSSGSFVLTGDGGLDTQQGSVSAAADGAASGEQLLITYGSKDNRKLMEQYGFVVPGNPHGRVAFPADLFSASAEPGWMSHKAVKEAAQAVLLPAQPAAAQAAAGRLEAAVASILQARGWRNSQQYRATSPASTAECAAAMLAWLTKQQALQTDPVADESRGRRAAAALQYRLERKQLLETTCALLLVLLVTVTPDGAAWLPSITTTNRT